MNFQTFFESTQFNIDQYMKDLSDYLTQQRGWRLELITDDAEGVSSNGYYRIIDTTGDTVGRDAYVGKIKRIFSRINGGTLTLEHVSAAFDTTGLKRIKGLGITTVLYPFERQYVLTHDVHNVVVDAVSSITKKKFMDTYAGHGFVVTNKGSKLVATKQ